jgi:hypothetical protein
MATVIIAPGVATVVLNASGNGTAKVGPTGQNEVWAPMTAAVSVATQVNQATCYIYAGDSAIPANFVDATLMGSTGDSTARVGAVVLRLGQFIWAVWTGGDAEQVATLNVNGTRQIGS